ncbi:MAG: hypothetical protein QGG64_20400, partial [Candidatus Latescibacteria bacterium]|nr:hypothetical protein [Candidatus Latescibacterota bacterium]
KGVLESGRYPYATFPLIKLRFHMPDGEKNRTCCLATLLAASRSPDPEFCLHHSESGCVQVESLQNDLPDLDLNDGDLSIKASSSSLEIQFSEIPDLPDALRSRSAFTL